jgi:hypothetical protein
LIEKAERNREAEKTIYGEIGISRQHAVELTGGSDGYRLIDSQHPSSPRRRGCKPSLARLNQ